jgi:hypothetical protein
MFEIIECKDLKKDETYYVLISKRLGYIFKFVEITTHLVICNDVELYDFEGKKTYINKNDPYDDTCFFQSTIHIYDLSLKKNILIN